MKSLLKGENRMRKVKRILAFVLLAAMLLCLSGCGSFESQITKAAKKMDALQSFHFDRRNAMCRHSAPQLQIQSSSLHQ